MYYMVYILHNLKHFFLATFNSLFEASAVYIECDFYYKDGIDFRVKLSTWAIITTEFYQILWIVCLPTKIQIWSAMKSMERALLEVDVFIL